MWYINSHPQREKRRNATHYCWRLRNSSGSSMSSTFSKNSLIDLRRGMPAPPCSPGLLLKQGESDEGSLSSSMISSSRRIAGASTLSKSSRDTATHSNASTVDAREQASVNAPRTRTGTHTHAHTHTHTRARARARAHLLGIKRIGVETRVERTHPNNIRALAHHRDV